MPENTLPSHADIMARLATGEREREEFRREVRTFLSDLQRAVNVVAESVESIEDKLGEEPDSDGHGGRGLIGDMRKTARDVQGLVDLRNKGIGAVAAVSLFGVLIIGGIVFWIQKVMTPTAKAKAAALVSAWGWA